VKHSETPQSLHDVRVRTETLDDNARRRSWRVDAAGDDASRCGRRGDRLPGWVGERCVEEGKIPVAVIHPAAADEAAGAHQAVKAHLDLKWTGTRPVPTWRFNAGPTVL
jgi:hypothetical protein